MVVKFVCEYNGKNFCGFQRQSKGRSVQSVLENALTEFFHEKIEIVGSGRTDAGVHARQQVCSFDISCTTSRILHKMLYKVCTFVNAWIVKDCIKNGFDVDLATREFELMHDGFHARHDVVRKTYLYRVYVSNTISPMREPYYHRIIEMPDLDAMQEYADMNFVGKIVDIEDCEDDIWFWVTGRGFTYKEVRRFVGQLIYGKPQVVPAKGLTLWGVEYTIEHE